MKPNKACMAAPAHVPFLSNRRILPVVIGQKRFNDIMGRSRMDKKLAAAAQVQEDLRYMQYLKDGSDYLCSRFTNMGSKTLDEERQEKLEEELKESEIRSKKSKIDEDLIRKKRILRAQRILNDLKPGQQALHHAMFESDVIYQRKYNEAINRDIQEDARRQRTIEEKMCPEILIPLRDMTEEELKAKDEAKKVMLREDNVRAIKEKRERKLAEEEQETFEMRVVRGQYECLLEEDQREAKKRKQRNIDINRRAYQDSLQDKAAARKYEQIRNDIENRINCVDVTKRRVLDKRYKDDFKARIAQRIKNREDRAIELCRLQQANKREAEERRKETEENYAAKFEIKEVVRQAQKEQLSKERRAYEQEHRKRAAERRQPAAEIQRFHVAERLKNMETNTRFYTLQKQRRDQMEADLKKCRNKDRDELIKRREEEKLNLCACEEDPYIIEDRVFFEEAKKAVTNAKMTGRPVYPLAKAVETYKRSNQLEISPETRMVGRRKIRDYCWPGFYSKAELAYRNYAARQECHQAQLDQRTKIFKDYTKIKEIAAEAQPQKCEMQCPYACYHHRGMPAIESVDSIPCQALQCTQVPTNTPDETGQGTKRKDLTKTPLKKTPSVAMSTVQLNLKEGPK